MSEISQVKFTTEICKVSATSSCGSKKKNTNKTTPKSVQKENPKPQNRKGTGCRNTDSLSWQLIIMLHLRVQMSYKLVKNNILGMKIP